MNKNIIGIIFLTFFCSVAGYTQENFQDKSPLFEKTTKLKSLTVPIKENERTQILILATPHLASLGEGFKASLVDNLIDTLQKFDPDIIGVERMPARLVSTLESQNRKGFYNSVENNRVEYGVLTRMILGLSRESAEQKAIEILQKNVNKEPLSDKERLQLILYLIASYNLSSATLQWSYLPETIRNNNKVIPKKIGQFLNERILASSEDISVGHRLAQKLNLQSIADIDDLQDEISIAELLPEFTTEISNHPLVKSVSEAPVFIEYRKQFNSGIKAGDLLPLYIFLNSEYLLPDLDAEWLIWLRTKLPTGSDRRRLALWEARNLSIATNIRRVVAEKVPPGGRMLVIIGASHKAFLDAYLEQMLDVKVVHLADLISQK